MAEDERAKLARLRKENAELQMRCDVLKRGLALWVQDSTPEVWAHLAVHRCLTDDGGLDPDRISFAAFLMILHASRADASHHFRRQR
ncbi:hypothetical protein [Streptosporangium sp. NPDC000396]|uniref:hypothetical protein n=1 Tax=Streptosporangium sp. NPDC000396 TaxID=3366185 RepID=UPI00368DA369